MPAQTKCPISEVDRTLASYTNSREDTLKIRRTLSKYLTSSLRPVTAATQNQHMNHECPQNLTATNTNPPGLKNVRLEYLHALRARNQAQAKHRELQASLEELRNRHADEAPSRLGSDYDNEVTRGYVSLLRQRRRFAELQAIQQALDKLLNTKPHQRSLDPKAVIKETMGEQPDLPAERLDILSHSEDDQSSLFKLKQEVLDAKAGMERAQAARKAAESKAPGLSTLQRQVWALERARDELVEWVQSELAKMEEDSVFLEDASPIKRSMNGTAPVDLTSAETHIRDAYNQYASARATLIDSYSQRQTTPKIWTEGGIDVKDASKPDNAGQKPTPSVPITDILPHLRQLVHISNAERSLLQQSVYLETQVASADQELEEALLRLSGESHLLPAGSKDVAAWGRATTDAETATEDFVKEHLQDSRQEVSSVTTMVELCSLQGTLLESI